MPMIEVDMGTVDDVLAKLDAQRAQMREERRRFLCVLQDAAKPLNAEIARLEALEEEAGDAEGRH